MRPAPPIVLAALLLAACGGPLRDVERLSDVPLGEGATAGAVPGPGETDDDPGVLAGLVAGARGDVDGVRAQAGQVLPFGRVATACGVEGAALGTAIAAEAGYALYDTDPGSVAPRTHFVTGFSDGCARQVTAAMALFGDLATHETVRYATPQGQYTPTDVAYEEVKARICGAASGQPCGAGLDRLARDTAFVTLYPAFGGAEAGNLLLHAGEVLAASF